MAATPAAPVSSGPKLKAFLNAKSGTAEAARDAIEKAGFELVEAQPADMEKTLKESIDGGAKRIVIAGGDGTVATAAALVAKRDVELAILPGGTLNHFGKDHNIPTDLDKATIVAADGVVIGADIGYLNDTVILNTSSIGAYVTFVRDREHYEKYVGYRIASLLAALRTWRDLRSFSVTLEVEGVRKTYQTSMVFIGVGERELKMPILGSRVKNGKRGLHVMVIHGRKKARLFMLAIAAISKGTKEAETLPDFDDFIVDSCRIDLVRSHSLIGLDGELKQMRSPLDYRIERDAIRLVVPPPEESE